MKKIIIVSLLHISSLVYSMEQPNVRITINNIPLDLDYIDAKTYKGILRAFECQKIYVPITNETLKKEKEKTTHS